MMIELQNVETGYGEVQIIFDVSMHIDKNEIVALVGANGAGKSTLMKTLTGMLPVWSGAILFEGAHIENTKAHEIIR